MIRILVVEDRPEIRVGLQMRLSAEQDMQVVGVACNGIEALDRADETTPDVVLMDVEMPLLDGIAACKQLAESHLPIPVVILTIHDDAATRTRACQAHAAGFVGKDKPVEFLLATIRGVAGSAHRAWV